MFKNLFIAALLKIFMNIRRLAIFLLIISGLALLSIYQPTLTGKTTITEYEPELANVSRVIDGDTIETNLGTVRLLGINTPEKGKPGYETAKQFLEQIENKTVELLRDSEDVDKYNRLLRYVHYQGSFVNLEILENGCHLWCVHHSNKYIGVPT